MENQNSEYRVICWFCTAEFNALDAPFCNHTDLTKICPFCLHCSCDAPNNYQKKFWENGPKELLEEKLIVENKSSFKLGEILIRAGKITKAQLKEAIEKQKVLKKRLGEVIVMMDLVTPDELQLYLVDQKIIEEIDLKKKRIDFKLIEKIGVDFCVLFEVIPLEEFFIDEHPFLRLAVLSKEKLNQIKKHERVKNYTVIPYMAKIEDIEVLLKKITREEDVEDVLLLGDDKNQDKE